MNCVSSRAHCDVRLLLIRRDFVFCDNSVFIFQPDKSRAMFDNRQLGLFVCICAQLYTIITAKNISIEQILRKRIFNNYDKVVIPNTRNSSLNVDMQIIIISAELDYEKSQMILSTWFIAKWIDDRLTWDPDDYEQMNSIAVGHHEIWHPDIMAYNNINANVEDDRTQVNSVLNNAGLVSWVQPVQYNVHCNTDTTHWPNDIQTGILRLGSWMYEGNILNLTADKENKVEVLNWHSEWDVTNVSMERNVVYYPCCPGEQYIDVKYNITIKRKVHPYQSIIYTVPALCCASFNLITFWFSYADKSYYCKLLANLFNALFVSVMIFTVYSKVPIVTSTVPLIVVYYTYNLALLAITTVISMTVKNMSSMRKPLPHRVTQFLHSDYLMYLGIEINDSNPTTDCHMLYESEDMNAQTSDSYDRRNLGKIIDRICFFLFTVIHLILLLRFIP